MNMSLGLNVFLIQLCLGSETNDLLIESAPDKEMLVGFIMAFLQTVIKQSGCGSYNVQQCFAFIRRHRCGGVTCVSVARGLI